MGWLILVTLIAAAMLPSTAFAWWYLRRRGQPTSFWDSGPALVDGSVAPAWMKGLLIALNLTLFGLGIWVALRF